jgi:hypothetical protein
MIYWNSRRHFFPRSPVGAYVPTGHMVAEGDSFVKRRSPIYRPGWEDALLKPLSNRIWPGQGEYPKNRYKENV